MSEGHEGVEDTWEVVERGLSDGKRCKLEDVSEYGAEVERVALSAQKLTCHLFFPQVTMMIGCLNLSIICMGFKLS